MHTEKLFYLDTYLKTFEARVLFCGQDERGSYVVLDRTAFYPEGGGQPSDRGILLPAEDEKGGAGPGAPDASDVSEKNPDSDGMKPSALCMIHDVQIAGDEIRHYITLPENKETEKADLAGQADSAGQAGLAGQAVSAGMAVCGVLDWDRRFDLMQQHSGEHLVSGFVHEKYGYNNVGFHMGEDLITIDFSGVLTEAQAEDIEARVNAYIWTNQKVHIFFPDEETRKTLPYRSKKELTGEVRLVEYPGGDLCACCGLHVDRTGEIGLVKLLSVKHFREGVRVEMVSGRRAVSLLGANYKANCRAAAAMSVQTAETAEAVTRLLEEQYALRGRLIQMQNERFRMRAAACKGCENVLLIEEDLAPADVRKQADAAMDYCAGICVVLSGSDADGYKYAVGQRDGDVRSFVKELNGALSGRGGGKPFFAQGSLGAVRSEIETFFAQKNFTLL